MGSRKAVVSIIIPVYKTQQFLGACMDSVLAQDYPALEIILVDDGSPDECPKMCDSYSGQYAHVKTIHQTNRGLGLSRNAGMDMANGDYIFFLDSDDKLDGKQVISHMVAVAQARHADIVVGSYRRFHGRNVSAVNVTHLHEGSYTKTVDFRFQGFIRYGHLAYNWGKLYKASFLKKHDLRCRAYPFTQDKAHNMACCAYEPVYAFMDESVCLYQVNEESVTFRYKENMMPVWISIASDFESFCRQRGIAEDYGDLSAFHIFFGSFYLVKQELKEHGLCSAVAVLRAYGRDPYVRKCMRALARGRYVRKIHAGVWKPAIWCAAVLFCMHGYWLYAMGIAALRAFSIDGQITKSRYRR